MNRPQPEREAHLGAFGRLLAGLVACAVGLGCGNRLQDAPKEHTAQLPSQALARVGDETIDESTVRHIAKAQRVSPSEARSQAVFDALMATGARRLALDTEPDVQVATRGVLAESLLRKLRQQADSTPSTPDEIGRIVAEHWLELDRPLAYRTVHAVVQVQESDGPQKNKAAHELARRIAVAVNGAKDADSFVQAANQVQKEGFEVRAEKLGPVTEDGRVADLEQPSEPGKPPMMLDKDFVAAVWRLKTVGELSTPIATPFGWHVILLTEMQPALQFPADQRASMVREEIVVVRVKQTVDRLLEEAKRATPARVERNAGTLMGMVAVSPKER